MAINPISVLEQRRKTVLGNNYTPLSISGGSTGRINPQQIIQQRRLQSAEIVKQIPVYTPQPVAPTDFMSKVKNIAGGVRDVSKKADVKAKPFLDKVFGMPDQLIDKAGNYFYQKELDRLEGKGKGSWLGKQLSTVQAKIVEPVFEKETKKPVLKQSQQVLRGIQRGITSTFLGSSKRVAEIYNKPID